MLVWAMDLRKSDDSKIARAREPGAPKRGRFGWAQTTVFLLFFSAFAAADQASAGAGVARYYFSLRDVEPAPGMSAYDPVVKLSREVLAQELARRSEVSTDLGGEVPEAALGEALKKRGLKGYRLTLRLLGNSRTIHPPARGKRYRVLERGVKLSVVGETLPGAQLAVGGDGESMIQVEVGSQISEQQEQEVLRDALRDAISQALAQAIRKLDLVGTGKKKR